jgi:hypothetical protein
MHTVKSHNFLSLSFYVYAYTKTVNEVITIIVMKSFCVINHVSMKLHFDISQTVVVSIIMIDVMTDMPVHCIFTSYWFSEPCLCLQAS